MYIWREYYDVSIYLIFQFSKNRILSGASGLLRMKKLDEEFIVRYNMAECRKA